VVEKKNGFRVVELAKKNGFRVRKNPGWKHYSICKLTSFDNLDLIESLIGRRRRRQLLRCSCICLIESVATSRLALNVRFTTNGMYAKNNTHMYMWREQAITKLSRRVISIVACCHSVKLCELPARAFRSQQKYCWFLKAPHFRNSVRVIKMSSCIMCSKLIKLGLITGFIPKRVAKTPPSRKH